MIYKVHDEVLVALPAGTLFTAEVTDATAGGDNDWYVVEIPAVRLTVPASALARRQPPEPDPVRDAIHQGDPGEPS